MRHQQRHRFSLIEIIVTVLILSSLITFTSLQFQDRQQPEAFKTAARELSVFLHMAWQNTAAQGIDRTLMIDRSRGRIEITPPFHRLDQFQLPEHVEISQVAGAQGDVWEDELIEILLPAQGLEESLQFTLQCKTLSPWTITWKLKGSVCSVDQHPEVHWPHDIERF